MKTIILFCTLLLPFYSNAQWAKLGLDIDGEAAGDIFGWSVSMNWMGDRIAVGAPKNDGTGADAGHVRVYDWNGVAWVQLGADLDGEAADNQYGIAVSLDSIGNRIVIGGNLNDGNGLNSGHTRVYEWDSAQANWNQLGIDIDGEAAGDNSGFDVSINSTGDIIAIGAGGNAGNGATSGHVRIFEWDTALTIWTQLGADIDGEAAGDNSGRAVSMNRDGNRVVIGAYRNNGNGPLSGHARVYEWNGTVWSQMGLDLDGEHGYDASGLSVSINELGDVVAIGAPSNSGSSGRGSRAGHVRVYAWDGISWSQMGADIDGEAIGDGSGRSVSLNDTGEIIAIGATGNDGNGPNSGHTRIFIWSGSSWIRQGLDIDGESKDDFSGLSVSMNKFGNRLIVGAPYNSGNGINAGHVRVYQYNIPTSINEFKNENELLIYPNPVDDNLLIETQNSIGEVAQIHSITGALLLEFRVAKEKEKLDLSGLQNGIYFLKVGELTKKIVVQH